jgi:serine/threonine-protein kinase
MLDAQGVTSTGQVLGSPAHMAPEQIEGGDVDGRADVFGLGVLLYECMVGHLPFLGNNPAQVLRRVLDGVYASAERERPTIGKVWSQILDRALARKPEARYQDAVSMRDAISAELSRLGMGASRPEIEAWLDDPEAWTTHHEKRLIERLCQLGAESRKKSDAVAAAADYNRALAYAPNDPSLLRIVSSMHRSEARARLVRRVAPLILGAVVLGYGAFFVARSFRHQETDGKNKPMPSAKTGESLALKSSSVPELPGAIQSGASLATGTPSVTGLPRVVATPVVPPTSAKPSSIQRVVTFSSLVPAFGIRMTIDGVPAPDPDPSKPITLDERPHTLAFTCAGDLCVPKSMPIEAGDKPLTFPVELAIPPAKLLIAGDPSHTYGIVELPNLSVLGGGEMDVPMHARGEWEVHVFDRSDPSMKAQAVTLHAGRRELVSVKLR